MASLRRRLIGVALLASAAVAFALASTVTPAFLPGSATGSGAPPFVTPTPLSAFTAPALLAAGSVLLVAGVTAVAAVDLSARLALLTPVIGALVAIAFALGIPHDPMASLDAITESGTLAMIRSGVPAAVAAGAVAGATVAPVVRAATTEDTITLLVGAVLLLVSVATASDAPLSLGAGGVAGVAAVGALWAVDPATWRP